MCNRVEEIKIDEVVWSPDRAAPECKDEELRSFGRENAAEVVC